VPVQSRYASRGMFPLLDAGPRCGQRVLRSQCEGLTVPTLCGDSWALVSLKGDYDERQQETYEAGSVHGAP